MTEKAILQLPLDEMDASLLMTYASIGAAFVDAAVLTAAAKVQEAAGAERALQSIATLAVSRHLKNDGYNWERWMAIMETFARLQVVAFPNSPPLVFDAAPHTGSTPGRTREKN